MSEQIHSSAIIDPSAEIGTGTTVGPFSIIGPNVKIGKDNIIGSHSVIQQNVTMGDGNKLDSFVSLGGDAQDLSYKGAPTYLEIGHNNVFREYVHINRAAKEGNKTVIGNGCYFMGGVHVGHDCVVADDVIMVTHAGLGGYSQVGSKAFVAAYTAVHQFVKIGSYVMIGFLTKVTQDIPPFTTCVGATDSVIVGLNSVGLKRAANISTDDRKIIKQMFQIYYQKKLSKNDALTQIKALPETWVRDEWVQFIEASTRGITPFGSHRTGG